ncbi:unnamed protein product [Periconia digitata]|uniref:Uncharacterized protein n=1 Tax=Periconia digitata TaxID=1303443 RepID=A0A9W4XEQ6_9PLEO|nr:unnamed protein product [Periconia digitata]
MPPLGRIRRRLLPDGHEHGRSSLSYEAGKKEEAKEELPPQMGDVDSSPEDFSSSAMRNSDGPETQKSDFIGTDIDDGKFQRDSSHTSSDRDQDLAAGHTVYTDSGYREDIEADAIGISSLVTPSLESTYMGSSINLIQLYTSELADEIYKIVLSVNLDDDIMERICATLPVLLKAFGLRIGCNARTQMHRDVMFFIVKHRHDVVAQFREKCALHIENTRQDIGQQTEKMPLEDILSRWSQTMTSPEETDHPLDDEQLNEASTGDLLGPNLYDVVDEDESDEMDSSALYAYRDFITKSPAYIWLERSLRKECLLVPAEPNHMKAIGKKITSCLPLQRKISRRRSSQVYKMLFQVEWDSESTTLEENQEYSEKLNQPFGTVMTLINYQFMVLTGSAENAQSQTVIGYLSQTWPSTGKHTMRLVEDALLHNQGKKTTCTLPDSTTLVAWLWQSKLMVEVVGIEYSIVEIGEQLAWLAAALRKSSNDHRVTYCIPIVENQTGLRSPSAMIDTTTNANENPHGTTYGHDASSLRIESYSQETPHMEISQEVVCKISATVEDGGEHLNCSDDQCWHNFFKNQVIVKGYPILRESKTTTMKYSTIRTESVSSRSTTESTIFDDDDNDDGNSTIHSIDTELSERTSHKSHRPRSPQAVAASDRSSFVHHAAHMDIVDAVVNPSSQPNVKSVQDSSVSVEAMRVSQLIANKATLQKPNTRYYISYTRALGPPLSDLCKRFIECIAGSPLSWYPLDDPEVELKAGLTRVYSKSFGGGKRFYDDIPTSLAEALFPRLVHAHEDEPKSKRWVIQRRDIVLLDTTLIRLLNTHFASSGVGKSMVKVLEHVDSLQNDASLGGGGTHAAKTHGGNDQKHNAGSPPKSSNGMKSTNNPTNPSSGRESSSGHPDPQGSGNLQSANNSGQDPSNIANSINNNSTSSSAGDENESNDSDEEEDQNNPQTHPVIFLCADIGPNESVVRTIDLHNTNETITDKVLCRELRNAYNALRSQTWWRRWFRWKRVTGIKFYRFKSFLHSSLRNRHYIDIHRDHERYPCKSDPEYTEYTFQPRPWPCDSQYPGGEVCFFFHNPSECGTSSILKETLPVRTTGPIKTRCRAFGIYVEERYSFWALVVLALAMVIFTLGVTMWFVPEWLRDHPGDLQNATVPVMLAVSVVSIFSNLLVSLFVVRMSSS